MTRPDPILSTRIDIELRMLRDAIELVASGASARVTLGGLQFGAQLLPRARGMAARDGLAARALYSTDETAGTDIVIERPDRPLADAADAAAVADAGAVAQPDEARR
jgi:hypothetical protein